MNQYAIIVAGGSGIRMGTDVPKQFIPVGGLPVLMHTLLRYREYSEATHLILVLPQTQMEYWEELCRTYDFTVPHQIVAGGNTRFQSVKNGLDSIADTTGLAAIHDGVRPFIHKEIIALSFEVAASKGNAIVAVALKDSIRVVDNGKNQSVDRSKYRIIQTPQTFRLSEIKIAFMSPELPSFTDDASVLEHSGGSIELIEGSYENIKITTPEDLILAEVLVKKFQ